MFTIIYTTLYDNFRTKLIYFSYACITEAQNLAVHVEFHIFEDE